MTITVTKQSFKLREILNALRKTVGIKGAELMQSNSVADVYNAIRPVMYRNLLINGGFQIAQRGTSFTDPGGYTLDRWMAQSNHTGSVVSQQSFTPGQTAVPGNPDNYYRASIAATTAAADRVAIMQRVENYKQVIGRTIILSGWYKCSAMLNGANWLFQIKRSNGFYDNSTELADPLGGLPQTNSWTYFTRKVFVPASALDGQTMTGTASLGLVYYYQSAPVAGTIEFANLQLEVGEQATPFENRPYATELALCQRYFEVNGNMYVRNTGTTTQEMRITWVFKTQKRATPTISVGTGGSTGVSVHCATVYQSDIAGGAVYDTSSQFTASAEL